MESQELRQRLSNVEDKVDNIQLGLKYLINLIESDDTDEEESSKTDEDEVLSELNNDPKGKTKDGKQTSKARELIE